MKTLDEVIKALGICDETVTANCPDCPYDLDCENVPGEDLRADALHYLKKYRETVTNCHQLRKGEWIPVDSPTVNGRCSECGYESRLYENDVYGEHYCPNCGAWLRMI